MDINEKDYRDLLTRVVINADLGWSENELKKRSINQLIDIYKQNIVADDMGGNKLFDEEIVAKSLFYELVQSKTDTDYLAIVRNTQESAIKLEFKDRDPIVIQPGDYEGINDERTYKAIRNGECSCQLTSISKEIQEASIELGLKFDNLINKYGDKVVKGAMGVIAGSLAFVNGDSVKDIGGAMAAAYGSFNYSKIKGKIHDFLASHDNPVCRFLTTDIGEWLKERRERINAPVVGNINNTRNLTDEELVNLSVDAGIALIKHSYRDICETAYETKYPITDRDMDMLAQQIFNAEQEDDEFAQYKDQLEIEIVDNFMAKREKILDEHTRKWPERKALEEIDKLKQQPYDVSKNAKSVSENSRKENLEVKNEER